ncbi:hypothetical protein D3C80_1188020 [compost metagenome]
MSKAADNLAGFNLCRSSTALGLGDNRREVLLAVFTGRYMLYTREAGIACCIQTVFIAVLRRHDAVGRHQNRTVEAGKLLVLFPPGITVVADKVTVFLKGRIIVGRQHLAVCIHVHPGAFRLLQQLLHVLQVMSADQNPRITAYADVNLGDFRVAVCGCIGLIKQSHHINAVLAAFQNQSGKLSCAQRVIQRGSEAFFHKSMCAGITEAQHCRMLHVSRHPLQPVGQQLAQGTYIFILCSQNAHSLRLGNQLFICLCSPERSIMICKLCCCPGQLQPAAPLVTQLKSSPDTGCKGFRNKVSIGYRCKQALYNEFIGNGVGHAKLPAFAGKDGNSFERINQQVLKIGYLTGLAAYPLDGTPCSFRRFLTLKTKHAAHLAFTPLK